MMTQHDKLCAGLRKMGAIEMPKKNKYTMFRSINGKYYFVGKAGALRVSSRPNAATSIPCNDRFRNLVMSGGLETL
jgi:hypothetical protein